MKSETKSSANLSVNPEEMSNEPEIEPHDFKTLRTMMQEYGLASPDHEVDPAILVRILNAVYSRGIRVLHRANALMQLSNSAATSGSNSAGINSATNSNSGAASSGSASGAAMHNHTQQSAVTPAHIDMAIRMERKCEVFRSPSINELKQREQEKMWRDHVAKVNATPIMQSRLDTGVKLPIDRQNLTAQNYAVVRPAATDHDEDSLGGATDEHAKIAGKKEFRKLPNNATVLQQHHLPHSQHTLVQQIGGAAVSSNLIGFPSMSAQSIQPQLQSMTQQHQQQQKYINGLLIRQSGLPDSNFS